jgi:putative transcriptional regulator
MRNRLSELRAQRCLTQAELADLRDVSRQTVISLEKGKYDPSLPLAFRIAAVFRLPIERIFEP